MAVGANRKISAASARAHTRRHSKNTSTHLPSGMLKAALAVLFIGFLAWGFQVIQPPPPKKCGSPNGPPVIAPRVKLRDGRHLAYREYGVPKDEANYKIIFIHGIDSCRHDGSTIAEKLSPKITEEMGVYIVSFDRPGYGESDPDLNRTWKSLALDIEELADQLGLGSKFYALGFSMGGEIIWSCLKYIPHRLAGAGLIAPVVNYWWSGLPGNLTKEAYHQQKPQDQWAIRVSHYFPWLTYWWNTQRWFPSSSLIARSRDILSPQDNELLPKMKFRKSFLAQVRQQGEYVSVHRDMNIGYGTWEFSPLDLENPFKSGEGYVHLWQGDEDLLVPVNLQRYIAQELAWIHYHELPGAGHMFPYADGMSNTIIESLLQGK